MYSGKEGAFVLKMVRWHRQKKNNGNRKKRIASAVCMLGVLVVCLGIVGYRNQLKADENLPVMTRGVIDKINQIPESKRNIYDKGTAAATLGTKENPFLILEIVPYEEYATFGYHISGCEPVDPKTNYGHGDAMELTNTLKTAKATPQRDGIPPAHFFADEPESKPDAYDADKVPAIDNDSMNKSYEGYYEMVEDGQGTFIQDASGKISKGTDADKDKRNIIWHTVCTTEKQNKYANETFKDASEYYDILENVGDRIYTKRVSTKEDPAYVTYGYYYYQNNDNFIKYSILQKKAGDTIDQNEVDNYCVIIKTITPKELNENPAWVDYADLYFVSRSDYQGGTTANIWKKYNRLKHTSTITSYTNSFENTATDKNRDISWPIVEKIFNKVTSDKNYAGMIMGSSVYSVGSYSNSKKPATRMQIYDWNLKKLYNEVDNSYATVDSGEKSNANMYKLSLMLLSMDTDLFKDLYMNKENPLIKDGEFLLRDGEDRTYWSKTTFLLMDSDAGVENFRNPYAYWKSDKSWEKYGIAVELSAYRVWVKGHFYSFNDDNSITFDYAQAASKPDSKFKDYQDYLDKFYDKENAGGTPSDSVRYILGDRDTNETKITGELNILDIEPCYDSKNGYSLQESYIRMMIPKFRGTIKITHMTTAEFIGNNEDLNSTYNMIFMGLDQGAYNTKYAWIDGKNGIYTYWNDSSMDGKVYFHTGDKMTAAEYKKGDGRDRSVKYLWSGIGNEILDDATLRFPGNDITTIKKTELESFLHAGYPIVAANDLYNLTNKIDEDSNIASLIKESKEKHRTVYQTSDTDGLIQKVKEVCPSITFTKLPNEYKGTTSDTNSDNTVSVDDSKANYLDVDDFGRSKLEFGFQITDVESAQYQCKVYIDQNQDGKFEEGMADSENSDNTGEVYYEGDVFSAGDGKKHITPVKLSKLYYGLIQWKIVVYRKDNPDIRFTRTGCSVAKNQTGQKRQIKVLQIMPDNDKKNQGYLDLKTDTLFTKYYKALKDYEISVDTITVEEFEKKYFSTKFTYNYSKDISAGNPSKMSDTQKTLYNKYNMFILGFGDTFHKVNMSNKNGAIDFLKYYIASGKSVLFTHDFTSMHNVKSTDFGYSANTYLRDVMGMNRYQAVSGKLTENERNELIAYQKKHSYDTMGNIKNTQGFTYYAMKRLGWTDTDNYAQYNKQQKVPYQYMIKSYKKDEYICSANDTVKLTGFNNNNDLTTRATKTNTGQITEYPFKISDTLSIASTHGQWYQLNMEDPEVTVWYCLSDNKNGDPCAWNKTDSNGDGTGATYGVSPSDAANNYYIYSKGNVFYSGVGHSTVKGDMEAKLFINTMIAAYRTAYEPPMVEILNDEAELLTDESGNEGDPNLVYKMNWMKEYENNIAGTKEKIRFSPVELNTVKTKLTCSIQYADGSYVDKIYKKDGTEISGKETEQGSGKYVFENLKNMGEYYFIYDTTDGKKGREGNVVFEIYNNKSKNPDGTPRKGKTTVKMESQNLFLLD